MSGKVSEDERFTNGLQNNNDDRSSSIKSSMDLQLPLNYMSPQLIRRESKPEFIFGNKVRKEKAPYNIPNSHDVICFIVALSIKMGKRCFTTTPPQVIGPQQMKHVKKYQWLKEEYRQWPLLANSGSFQPVLILLPDPKY